MRDRDFQRLARKPVKVEAKVAISDEKKTDLMNEMAALGGQIMALEEERRKNSHEINERLKELKARNREVITTVNTMQAVVLVDGEEGYDFAGGKVYTRRSDTKEIVDTRDLTDEERSQRLFNEEGGEGKEEKVVRAPKPQRGGKGPKGKRAKKADAGVEEASAGGTIDRAVLLSFDPPGEKLASMGDEPTP